MLQLRVSSSNEWLNAVLEYFDAFLLDHASAERKALAVALSLISHYPDRKELVTAMMDLAREELDHFHQVYLRIDARGGTLGPDSKDSYVRSLLGLVRRGPDLYFLDRLLVSGIIEARGCERFSRLAAALEETELRDFYDGIARSEKRHRDGFVELARLYFSKAQVDERIEELLDAEAKILADLEIRPALH